MTGFLLYYFLYYPFEIESLTEPRTVLFAQQVPEILPTSRPPHHS